MRARMDQNRHQIPKPALKIGTILRSGSIRFTVALMVVGGGVAGFAINEEH